MDLCTPVGRNVRHRRRAPGLMQEEPAHHAGFDHICLNHIERGIRGPTVLPLRDLAAVLGVHPEAPPIDDPAIAAKRTGPSG